MGFDPELQTNKPLCPGSGKLVQQKNTKGYGYIEPVKKLMAPLFILQGDKDLASPISTIRQYIEGMLNVKLIELQNVGHGFSYSANWVPQCRLALLQIEKDSGFVLETNVITSYSIHYTKLYDMILYLISTVKLQKTKFSLK